MFRAALRIGDHSAQGVGDEKTNRPATGAHIESTVSRDRGFPEVRFLNQWTIVMDDQGTLLQLSRISAHVSQVFAADMVDTLSGGVRQGIGTETSSALSRIEQAGMTYQRVAKRKGPLLLTIAESKMFHDALKPAWL